MKLVPKAKPVRFYIESGNVECTSMKTLRENFDIMDVEKLMDGRFVRWLNLIGERDLAEAIQKCDIDVIDQTESNSPVQLSENGILTLLNICFEKEWKSIYDAYIELSVSCCWKSAEYPFISNVLATKEIHELLSMYNDAKEKNLLNLLCAFHSEIAPRLEKALGKDEERLFAIGLALMDSEDKEITKKGRECIKRAKILGDIEAKEWLENQEKLEIQTQKSRSKRRSIPSGLKPYELDLKIRNRIKYQTRSNTIFPFFNAKTLEEKAILSFCHTCQYAQSINSNEWASKIIIGEFDKTQPTDFLGEEKLFLLAKATHNRSIYESISDYGPAKSVLTGESCCGFYFMHTSLQYSIDLILDNFFRLSAYGRETDN